MAKPTTGQPGGAPIGSRQGGAPDALNETQVGDTGKAHKRKHERDELAENPNLNQAGNERGSADNTSGSQTGADIE